MRKQRLNLWKETEYTYPFAFGLAERLEQMRKKRYTEVLVDADIHHILQYGIACNRKNCRVLLAETEC